MESPYLVQFGSFFCMELYYMGLFVTWVFFFLVGLRGHIAPAGQEMAIPYEIPYQMFWYIGICLGLSS